MQINSSTKLANLVNRDYHILPVLNRFGICTGFGDKTIGQICRERNINVDFLLEILNTYLDRNYLPRTEDSKFTLSELIAYLRETHKYYRVKLQYIEYLLTTVINNCCWTEKEKIDLILRFFGEYKTDLLKHIEFEDNEFYPYILELEQVTQQGGQPSNTYNISIEQYLKDHASVEDKIVDIKTLILKYLPVQQPSAECNQLLFDLYDFEKDLLNHQSIEERVLLPRALKLEEKYKKA